MGAIAQIKTDNRFSDWETVGGNGLISISGVFDATVTLQIRAVGSGDIFDLETFDAPSFRTLNGARGAYRLGVKSGEFNSGVVHVAICG